MTLDFTDSFDHYSQSMVGDKYVDLDGHSQARGTIVTSGRNGNGFFMQGPSLGGGFLRKQSIHVDVNSQNSWCVGFAWNFGGLGASAQQGIYGGSQLINSTTNNSYVALVQFPDYSLGVTDGSNSLGFNNVIGFSTIALQPNTWYYIEFNYTLTAGKVGSPMTISAIVSVNGVKVIDCSGQGQNTPGSGATVDTHNFAPPNNPNGFATIDDIYIGVTSSTSVTNFLGDCKTLVFLPTSDVSGNQWTGAFADIDSNPPNDSSFIQDTTTGDESFFGFQQITGSAGYIAGLSVMGVCTCIRAEADAIGDEIAALLGTSLSSWVGLSNMINTTTAFQFFSDGFATNLDPAVDAPWSVANFNSEKFGIKKIA